MDERVVTELRDIAVRFRRALEEVGPSSTAPALRRFPHRSCADAVLLLGAYLHDQGFGPFDAVGGAFESEASADMESHAWLERDGVIVDITADQFPDVTARVIVTRDPRWHQRFHTNNRGVADFRSYGPDVVAQLGPVYEEIVVRLRAEARRT